jgi:DNA-binding transcriptional LysR family regulator
MASTNDCRFHLRTPASDSATVELRQLEHFLAVVEEGSFTRAAAKLFMVQSSLSASLLGLERELGTDLFIRGHRGAELTDAGRALLEPAKAALAETDRARDAVAAVEGLVRGSVRIAAVTMPRSVDVGETIRQFQADHPGVDVHVAPVGARDMIDLVIDGQVDFAITPRIDGMTPTLRFESLVSTPIVLLCPTGHRLAGARDLDPAEVVDECLIDLPRGWRARELFDRLLDERGVDRRVGVEINDWLAVLTMVQRGTGISYGPLACIDAEMFTAIGMATMAGAPLWELGVVSREESLRGAAGRAFLSAYLERCRDRSRD